MLPRRSHTPVVRVGFSLVELLVTIAVLGILFAILIPVVGSVTEDSRKAASLSNLRQLAAGHKLFVADNKGKLVPVADENLRTWRAHLAPYVGAREGDTNTVFHSPADEKSLGVPLTANGVAPVSYGLNNSRFYSYDQLHYYPNRSNPTFSGWNKTMANVRNPSGRILFCDIGRVDNPGADPSQWEEREVLGNYGYARFPVDPGFNGGDAWNVFPRHRGREVNVVFYDGHAETVDLVTDIIDKPWGHPDCIYDNR